MSKKTIRRMKNVLFVVMILLLGALAVIYGVAAQNAKKELERIAQEKEELKETIETLQQENTELKEQQETWKKENIQREEQPKTVDMRASEPGAIIHQELINVDNLQSYFCSYEIEEGDDVYHGL